ncbi:MAG: protein TolR [Burkholderiales bacterium]
MRQRRLKNEINVVPYIDVMLVLLVIFMVTAPLVTPGVIDLPSVGKASLQPPVPPVEIQVRADGSLSIRETAKGQATEQKVTQAQLATFVRDLQRRNPEQPVLIAGDKEVKYEMIMKVMDELQRQNVKRVGLLVKPDAR